jgi:SAM-dependent methyltransferase
MSKDYLWLHLTSIPYFRAMVRSVEARFLHDIDLPSPVLDLGCGDGHYASIAFEQPVTAGIDPWIGPAREAARRNIYNVTVLGEGACLPFADGYFSSVVSNSVLEHIPLLSNVLTETGRVLAASGKFVFCVPNDRFLMSLSNSRFLERFGLRNMAQAYRSFFNRISRHYHCDSPETWEKKLEETGFRIERWWHYFSPQALAWMEWGHLFGLPSLLSRWTTGQWILSPTRWNLWLIERLVRRFYDADPVCDDGVYTFYIARKL